MQALITSSTTVTTSYQTQSRLLCPPRHLFTEVPVAQTPPCPQPAAPLPCLPPDNYRPAPVQAPAPFDGIAPDQVRVGNVGELLIGGFTGNATHLQFADAIGKLRANGMNVADLKTLGQASLKAGGISAGITAAVSTFQNIGAAASGKISVRDAVSNVTTDTVGGMLAGTTAGIGAGAATLALRSFGASGLVLTIGAAAAGALGGIGGNKIYEMTGLRGRVFKAAQAFLG